MAEEYDREYAKKVLKAIERRGKHRLFFRKLEVIGAENLNKSPGDKPRLLLVNHNSHADYLITWLQCHIQKTQMPMIAAGTNLDLKLLQLMGIDFGKLGAFWVDRDKIRETPRDAVRYTRQIRDKVGQLMKDGHDILVFPEGGRSYDGKLFTRYKTGIIKEVLRTQPDIDIVNMAFHYSPRIEEGYFTALQIAKHLGKPGKLLYVGLDAIAFASRYLRRPESAAYMNVGKPQPLESIAGSKGSLCDKVSAVKHHSKEEIKKLYAEISKR